MGLCGVGGPTPITLTHQPPDRSKPSSYSPQPSAQMVAAQGQGIADGVFRANRAYPCPLNYPTRPLGVGTQDEEGTGLKPRGRLKSRG